MLHRKNKFVVRSRYRLIRRVTCSVNPVVVGLAQAKQVAILKARRRGTYFVPLLIGLTITRGEEGAAVSRPAG